LFEAIWEAGLVQDDDLLIDAHGAPLSIIVTGANRHDVTQLEDVLAKQKMKYPPPVVRRNKHLCADNGYRGAPAQAIMARESSIPHVQGRSQEARQSKQNPAKRPRPGSSRSRTVLSTVSEPAGTL
jgi:transposase